MNKARRLFGIGLTSSSWRVPYEDFAFTDKECEKLMETTADIKPWNKLSEGKFNILVIGPKAHGKSSLINAVTSLSQKKQIGTCNTGGKGADGDNVTVMFRHYDFLGKFKHFRMCDVRGLIKERESSVNYLEDLSKVIEGKVKSDYKFDVKNGITEQSEFYNSKPTLQDKMHGVIIVYDIKEAYDIHALHVEDLRKLKKLMDELNVPVFLFLTKVDQLCHHVCADISTIYHSRLVRDTVYKAEERLGIRRKNIYPIVNFEDEVRFKCNEKIPLLVALNDCLLTTRQHLFNTEKDSRIDASAIQVK